MRFLTAPIHLGTMEVESLGKSTGSACVERRTIAFLSFQIILAILQSACILYSKLPCGLRLNSLVLQNS